MDDTQKLALERAKVYLRQVKEILQNAPDDNELELERAAAGVTVAYEQIESFNPVSKETLDFEDSLIEVDHAPGVDTSQVKSWVPLTDHLSSWTRPKVEEQVSYLEKLIAQLENG